jgi:hypothetical protein
MKKITAVILTFALLAATIPAFADTERDDAIAGDTVFGRPLGVVSIVGGFALWVASLPFAAISGSLPATTDALITKPVKYTFDRPMGDFDYEPAPEDAGGNKQQ